MENADFDLKDYILVGSDFHIEGKYTGVIDRTSQLPTRQFPSDHSLIGATIIVRPQIRRLFNQVKQTSRKLTKSLTTRATAKGHRLHDMAESIVEETVVAGAVDVSVKALTNPEPIQNYQDTTEPRIPSSSEPRRGSARNSGPPPAG